MVLDTLSNAGLYHGLGAKIKTALDFLCKSDFSLMESGRHDIDGDHIFALVQQYESKAPAEGVWEAHRRYIDVQYIASGEEIMGVAPVSTLTESKAYQHDKDVLFLTGGGEMFTLRAGTFAIFFPTDAHMPGLAVDQPAIVQKVVIKVSC